MKNLIIFSLIFLLATSYTSMQVMDSINKPTICVNCHGLKHQGNYLFSNHSNQSINCIDCHSDEGVKGYIEARKELVSAILLEKAKPVLNHIFQNMSYNISFIHFQANCTKCHRVNGTPEKPETGLWKKMGTGGHRNKTCEDCHASNFKIPMCTDCHKPHREEVYWDNNACLSCHNSPHIPVRNGSFSKDIPKENCGVCHKEAYDTLAFYNSRHNMLISCAGCHPQHKENKKCFDCHVGQHLSHPYAQENCAACHGKATCIDCHKEPHAPLLSLPKLTTKEQFNNYAATRKGH